MIDYYETKSQPITTPGNWHILNATYKQEEPCEVGPPMRETFKHGSVGTWG